MTVPSQFRIFDHIGTPMEPKAKACGFTKVDTTESLDAKDEQAAKILLNDPYWKLSLVHINPGPWERLCREARAGQVIVRLSTKGFGCLPNQGTNALCLHCLKTTSEITTADISALQDVLVDESKQEAIRKEGEIDTRIRQLVALAEPHRLRALHILMQGVLAVWASSPGRANQKRAAELLGVRFAPPLSGRRIVERQTLQRALGLAVEHGGGQKLDKTAEATLKREIEHELGLKKDSLDGAIADLLDDICKSANGEIVEAKIFDAFGTVDAFLKKR